MTADVRSSTTAGPRGPAFLLLAPAKRRLVAELLRPWVAEPQVSKLGSALIHSVRLALLRHHLRNQTISCVCPSMACALLHLSHVFPRETNRNPVARPDQQEGQTGMGVRVLIADESELVRTAVRQHLECIGCVIVAETESAAPILPLFRTAHPQVVVLGQNFPFGGLPTPVRLIRIIKREVPETCVLVIAQPRGLADNAQLLRAGALECVLQPLRSRNPKSLWHRLAGIFPELRDGRFGRITAPDLRPIRGAL